MSGQIDLAKGAFANEAAECVIANRLQVLVGELIQQFLVRVGKLVATLSARILFYRDACGCYLGLPSMRLRLPPCRLHPSAPT